MVLLDSSFLIAYHNRDDVHHPAAAAAMERFLDGEWGRGLLAEYVFLEVTTVLALRLDRQEAIRIGELLLHSRELELVPCSDLFFDAFEVFRGQEGGDLSFVDSALVALARRRGTSHLLTFDAGFGSVEDVTVLPDGSRDEG